MAIYTIKIDQRNKAAKAFIEMIKNLPFIEIVEGKTKLSAPEKDASYNPAFVRKIKKAQKEIEEGKGVEIDPDDIWGSIGL